MLSGLCTAACSDFDTLNVSTVRFVWCHAGQRLGDSHPGDAHDGLARVHVDARTDEPACRLWRTRLYSTSGLMLSFEADVETDTVRVQLSVPNPELARTQGLTAPSHVLVLTLPKSMPLGEFRPAVMLYGPATVVDADPDAVPRFCS